MTVSSKLAFLICGFVLTANACPAETISEPLRVHPDNPRYFADGTGKAILLTGSHTWNNLVDMGPTDPPAPFDYDEYLEWLANRDHNFFRLWAWELVSWDTRGNREERAENHVVAPHPWKRMGPGKALDGKPKFDLQQYNEDYFNRLRKRVAAAQDRGIYAAVMLFEGWGIQFSPDGWRYHPFHPDNNVNGVDGDLDGDGQGLEIHTMRSEQVTRIQQAYVRKVIDTVNDLDNVLFEISNENHPPSTDWQYSMIRLIKRYEKSKPKQHPVGMTFQYKGGTNKTLFDSPADWISPNHEGGYRDNPPAGDGSKVVICDTDHLWGIGGNPAWVWRTFTRGLNPIFMDPYDGSVLTKGFGDDRADPIRDAQSLVRRWSKRVDLAAMTPRGKLASSGFCLANPGVEYIAFFPGDKRRRELTLPKGEFEFVWLDIASGKASQRESLAHSGGRHLFKPPYSRDASLYIRAVR